VGVAYRRIGDIHQRLVHQIEAEKGYQKASEQLQKLADEFPRQPEYRYDLALAKRNLGRLQRLMGRFDESDRALRQSQTLLEQLVRDDPTHADYRNRLASTYHEIGRGQEERGKLKEAEFVYRMGLELLPASAVIGPADQNRIDAQASNLQDLAVVLIHTGRRGDAEQDLRRALALRRQQVKASSQDREIRYQLSAVHRWLALLLSANEDRQDEATKNVQECMQILEALAKECPTVPSFQRDLAAGYEAQASLDAHAGRQKKADTGYAKAVAVAEKLVHDHPAVPSHLHLYAVLLNNRGAFLMNCNRWSEAKVVQRKALKVWEELARSGHSVPEQLRAHANCLQNLAGSLIKESKAVSAMPLLLPDLTGVVLRKRNLEEACGLVEEAIRIQKVALSASPLHVEGQSYLAGHFRQLASIQEALGRTEDVIQTKRTLEALSKESVRR
jgi:tetratricopeptide (TPR) repeat protein